MSQKHMLSNHASFGATLYQSSSTKPKPTHIDFKKPLLGALIALLAILIFIPAQAHAQDSEKIDVPQNYAQLTNWSRLSGENRIDTMAAISNAGFDSSNTVIVAYSNNFPDALSATSLAGYYKCPILLTGSGDLEQKTASEIERLGASNVIIVGGEAGVSSKAETQIKNIDGVAQVNRISGENRFKTSEAIYDAGNALGAWDSSQTKTAIVASGTGFADALSMSSYAYAESSPIFLTGSDGNLTKESFKAIFKGNFDRVIIAGGEGVVSEMTEDILQAFFGDDNAARLAGENRYETSSKIVSWCIEQGMSYDGLAIAYGGNFPDALSGGALCGSQNSVVMLVSTDNYSDAQSAISKNKTTIKKANILGGTGALPTSLYQTFQRATLKEATNISNAVITISTTPANNVYTGGVISAAIDKVTLDGVELPQSAYTQDASSTLSATNAGSYTISVTGNAPDYTGTATATWEIAQAELPSGQIPSGLSTTAYTKQKLSNVVLPALPSGYAGSLSWKDSNESVGDNVGTVVRTAIYEPADTNYKSVEVNVSIEVTGNSYWIAPAKKSTTSSAAPANNPNYVSPETDIVRSQAQITEDMTLLHEGESSTNKTSDGLTYSEVKAKYLNWMQNDNYHLYTLWNGTDAGDGENKWVEFRIIQVGEHDSDGSAVTFMATHALPSAKQINPVSSDGKSTNAGGWSASVLKSSMISGGDVYSGLGDLAKNAKVLSKSSSSYNSDDGWVVTTSINNQIWLLSYSEVFGEDGDRVDVGAFNNEGSQYSWFANKITNSDGYNSAISSIDKTRSGDSPKNSNSPNWWHRSPLITTSSCFGTINTNGAPDDLGSTARYYSVVPCLAL